MVGRCSTTAALGSYQPPRRAPQRDERCTHRRWTQAGRLCKLVDRRAWGPGHRVEHSALVGIQVDGWSFKAAWQTKIVPSTQPSVGVTTAVDRPADVPHMPRLRIRRAAAAE